jgi:hypothetical protein
LKADVPRPYHVKLRLRLLDEIDHGRSGAELALAQFVPSDGGEERFVKLERSLEITHPEFNVINARLGFVHCLPFS